MAPSVPQAGTEGANSTLFGTGAGAVNSSDANDNTFIGSNAGHANTSGTVNTFVGRRAGSFNVGGDGNTFVGFAAGENNLANSNTFVGRLAGTSNSIGTRNTFLGHQAGISNAGGNDNTVVGAGAGAAAMGINNIFIGSSAGAATTSDANVFVGRSTGISNVTGSNNVFIGNGVGVAQTSGTKNTYLGDRAGANNISGTQNVFLGNQAGYSETGSHKLYIDDCQTGGTCTNPLIYGEFDNKLLRFNGKTEVHYNGLAKSQLNFSLISNDTGGWLTSVLENNFFMSSGARYDGALVAPNQWVQRSTDGNAVIQGSGGVGYRLFTSSGNAVNDAFNPTVRLHINYAGEFGINQAPVAGHEIHTSSGAYLASGTWTNASSRDLKDNIRDLPQQAASEALAALRPVLFNYRSDAGQQHVGFIAEDVPELVAMKDRKGLSPMDIVAVLTKVVQQQASAMSRLEAEVVQLRTALANVSEAVERKEVRR
jgi:hypothetical protein